MPLDLIHPSHPVRARRVPLRKQETAAEAFDRLLAENTAMIAANLAVSLRADDPEGPHQLRVALRRLRVLLSLHKPMIDPDTRRGVADAARALARAAGAVRDADVLALDLLDAAAPALEPAAHAALAERLAARRRAVRLAFRDDGAVVSGAGLLLAAHQARLSGGWRRSGRRAATVADGPARALAAAGLGRAWGDAAAWGARLDALSIDERHEMRKALKRLRYACQFFEPLYPPKRTGPFIAQLKKLQTVFGYLNDVAGAGALRDLATSDPALAPAAEAAIAWHQDAADRAWTEARGRWKALRAAKRFW